MAVRSRIGMLRVRSTWLGALWIGTMVHVDWHLGRPGHDHLSFHFGYHWLLALAVFPPLAWFTYRKWPDAPYQAALLILLLGILLGQGLEPLGEVLTDGGLAPFINPIRWRLFAEFVGLGSLVLLLGVGFLRNRAGSTR